MANTEELNIVIKTEFEDRTSDKLKKTEKSIGSMTSELEEFNKKFKTLGNSNAEPKLSLRDMATKKIEQAESNLRHLDLQKAQATASLRDQVTGNLSRIRNNLTSFAGRTYLATADVKDIASGAINDIKSLATRLTSKPWEMTVSVLDKATAPIKNLWNYVTSFQGYMTGIFASKAFQSAVTDPIGLADFYSESEIGFSTLLGSAEEAAKKMDEIKQFAMKTPFKTKGLVETTQKMLAMGWESEKLIPDLEKIGNAMAALGKGDEGIERTTLALSQMRAKGKVSAEEMNQLTEVGIAGWDYLSKKVGKTTAETQDMVSKGLIPVETAIEGIIEGMGQFDGMMDKTANSTVSGLLSQMQDVAEINIFAPWGKGLQEGAVGPLSRINDLLGTVLGGTSKVSDTLYNIAYTISDKVMTGVERFATAISDVVTDPDFDSLSLGEKINKLLRDGIAKPVKDWWNSGGRDMVKDMAKSGMELMGEVIMEGVPIIIESAFSNPVTGTIAAGYGFKMGSQLVGGLVNAAQGGQKAVSSIKNTFTGLKNISKFDGFSGFAKAVKDSGSVIGALQKVGQATKNTTKGFKDIAGASSVVKEALSKTAKEGGSITKTLTDIMKSSGTAGGALESAGSSAGVFGGSLGALGPAAAIAAAAVGTVIVSMKAYEKAQEETLKRNEQTLKRNEELAQSYKSLAESAKSNREATLDRVESSVAELEVAEQLADQVFNAKEAYDEQRGSIEQIQAAVETFNAAQSEMQLTYDTATDSIRNQKGEILSSKDAIYERIQALKDEAIAEAAKESIVELYKQQFEIERQMKQDLPGLQQAWQEMESKHQAYLKAYAENPGSAQTRQLALDYQALRDSFDEVAQASGELQGEYQKNNEAIAGLYETAYGVSIGIQDITTETGKTIMEEYQKMPQSAREAGVQSLQEFQNGQESERQNAVNSANQTGKDVANALENQDYKGAGGRSGSSFMEGFKGVLDGMGNWVSEKLSSVGTWFSNFKNTKSERMKGNVTLPGHAEGGILSTPHLAFVAEDGPEAIIPLGSKRHSKGVKLWEEAGKQLGVYNHAEGGVFGDDSGKEKALERNRANLAGKTPEDTVSEMTTKVNVETGNSFNGAQNEASAFSKNMDTTFHRIEQSGHSWWGTMGADIKKETQNALSTAQTLNQTYLGSYNGFGASLENATDLTYTQMARTAGDQTEEMNSQSTSNFDSLLSNYGTFGANFLSATDTTFTSFVQSVSSYMGLMNTTVSNGLATTVNTIRSFGSQFNQAGQALMTELNAGISSKISEVVSTTSSLVQQLKDTFTRGLGIHSPSRFMQWVGEMMGEGAIKGLTNSQIQQFAENMVKKMKESFAGGNFNAFDAVDFLGNDTLKLIGYLTDLDDSGVANTLAYPVQNSTLHVTSPFGPRWGSFHYGNDLAASHGQGILAALSGTVTRASSFAGYGNAIDIDHGGGTMTRYGHLNGFNTSVGSSVKAGQLVGTADNTGHSFGDHLHFEIRKNGTAVDPLPYLQGATIMQEDPLVQALRSAYTLYDVLGGSSNSNWKSTATTMQTSQFYNPSGGVEQWRSTVMQALALTGQPLTHVNDILWAIQNESSGNPRAINNWDSNAKRGDPSRGLMQTIGSTFRAYKMEGLSDDIYDPLSNIVASIRYMVSRYGSIEKVMESRRSKWRGYATGTDYATPGLHWVGENGPELLQFKGGERVYTNEESMAIAKSFESGALGNTDDGKLTQVTKINGFDVPFTMLDNPGNNKTVSNSSDNSVTIEAGAITITNNIEGGDTKEIVQKIEQMNANTAKDILIQLAQKLSGGSEVPLSGGIA